jgi:hypothetical protein
MGDLHFLNWVRLVVFTFDRITEFPGNQAAPLVWRESSRAVLPQLGPPDTWYMTPDTIFPNVRSFITREFISPWK